MDSDRSEAKFEAMLDHVKRSRGFDFTGYKRSSLMRRVNKRLMDVGVKDYIEYIDFLEVHPDEFTFLFNTILINVTSFFRDEAAWKYLQQEIIPEIVRNKLTDEPIRVWCAGCASGEEAYSLAILFAEQMGVPDFHRRVKIYATDVDEEALAQARLATYDLKNLPQEFEAYKDKYFSQSRNNYVFNAELRRMIIFGRHDLVQDAPISRLDLISCRNTLMYMNAETQARILSRLHFALHDTGYLFLGRAEMLLSHSGLFAPTELKFRVFSKAQTPNTREKLMVMAQTGDRDAFNNLNQYLKLREASFDVSPVAQIVVDVGGALVLANERARSAFGLAQTVMGRPLQDLEISYRPVELRSLIEQAYQQHSVVRHRGVERQWENHTQHFDLTITPLLASGSTVIGASVIFQDVTNVRHLEADLVRNRQELETTTEELQSAHEELETTNEELQSTNEELETTNEELQSTNEELETMNEELQCTNEELETINNELRQITVEVNTANVFLHSILRSLRSAVIVIDENGQVMIWNHRAEELWGLRADEVIGEDLKKLDIGLPVTDFMRPMQELFSNGDEFEELEVEAINRRGQPIICQIRLTRLDDKDPGGMVIFIDDKKVESAVESN